MRIFVDMVDDAAFGNRTIMLLPDNLVELPILSIVHTPPSVGAFSRVSAWLETYRGITMLLLAKVVAITKSKRMTSFFAALNAARWFMCRWFHPFQIVVVGTKIATVVRFVAIFCFAYATAFACCAIAFGDHFDVLL
jgi:hypothetical protein